VLLVKNLGKQGVNRLFELKLKKRKTLDFGYKLYSKYGSN
jgi:hypothetical protein